MSNHSGDQEVLLPTTRPYYGWCKCCFHVTLVICIGFPLYQLVLFAIVSLLGMIWESSFVLRAVVNTIFYLYGTYGLAMAQKWYIQNPDLVQHYTGIQQRWTRFAQDDRKVFTFLIAVVSFQIILVPGIILGIEYVVSILPEDCYDQLPPVAKVIFSFVFIACFLVLGALLLIATMVVGVSILFIYSRNAWLLLQISALAWENPTARRAHIPDLIRRASIVLGIAVGFDAATEYQCDLFCVTPALYGGVLLAGVVAIPLYGCSILLRPEQKTESEDDESLDVRLDLLSPP